MPLDRGRLRPCIVRFTLLRSTVDDLISFEKKATNGSDLLQRSGSSNRDGTARSPHGHWVNMTYVCALRKSGVTAPHSFEGAMNKERFDEYVRNVLCPTLRPGDIVVWDNLPAHKSAEAKRLVEEAGATLMRLPSYSPDLKAIEMSFSKLKSILRKEKIRDVGELLDFLRRSGELFSPIECENYFRHAGYCLYE